MKEKITFFLMGYKGLDVLKKILNRDLENSISLVIIGIDRHIQNDYSRDIISLCKTNNLKYIVNEKQKVFVKTKFCIAISWRWLINCKKAQLIILHDSILPKYRGFAPLVNQLINGETQIGVTAILASDEYDKGPIITSRVIPITYPLRIQEAIEVISKEYGEIIVEIVNQLNNGQTLKIRNQVETDASYSLWRDDEDYQIDWTLSASKLCRFINAVSYPYNFAYTYLEDKKIRITDAEEYPDVKIENRDHGKILFIRNDKPVIVCRKGLIKIKEAFYDDTRESIFPLPKFRCRFK